MRNFDEDLDINLDNMKKQMSEYKLSDEFKSNLKLKLDKEYEEVNKSKITNKLNFFPRQLVAAMACLVIVFSTCAFADNIGNCINKCLSNADKELQTAIENGKVQNVDMDYIKTDDLSIRVSKLVVEENNLYIVFDVLTEEDATKVLLQEFKILDDNNNIIFDSRNLLEGNSGDYFSKQLSAKDFLLMSKLEINDIENNHFQYIEVQLDKIKIINNDKTELKEVNIKFEVEI